MQKGRSWLHKGFVAFAMMAGLMTPGTTASASAQDAGDPDKGRVLFNQCRGCHSLTAGGPRKAGPHLQGLFSRTAGSLDTYRYSKALQDADFAWTEDKLEEWLANPRSFLPGNRMTYLGMRREADRKNLIAYLRAALDANTQSE